MFFAYGQETTLLQNVNYRAKELKHSLTQNGDSLILSDTRLIYKVEIFNADFEKTINIADFKAKIPLYDIPIGRYVVDATLIDKHIIMTLIRNENFKELPKKEKDDIATDSIIRITHLKTKTKKSYIDRHAQLLSGKQKKTEHKVDKHFWIKYSIKNGNTSYETMELVNQESVDKLISKNKIENKTFTGELNKLVVWVVYNRPKFIQNQVTNSDYINSSTSDFLM